MSKLFKIKQWVTAQQALEFLNTQLESSFSKLDVLQLIAEQELKYSVKFEHRVPAKIGKVVQFKDVPLYALPNKDGERKIFLPLGKCLVPGLKGGKDGTFEWDDETPFACFEKNIGYIDGIWDFAMVGNEVVDVANMIRAEIKLGPLNLVNHDGVFLCRPDGTYANLHTMFIPDEEKNHYSEESSLFQHASIGFRTAELKRFIAEINDADTEDFNHDSKWPWGSHNTVALDDLVAAAKRFWVSYDPDEVSTAPTNEEVIEWLRKERGTSLDKAKGIASILKADGIRNGPRRSSR